MKLENITFSYDNNHIILDGINYEFEKGKHYVMRGENGAGKTTLLKLILGFIKSRQGKIFFDKDTVFSYCPDHNGLYEDLSVWDNIIFRLAIYKQDYEPYLDKINELLIKYNLMNNKNKKVNELSHGMKKKTALIASFIVDYDYLILDEPTNGIDDKSKREVIRMINNFQESEKTIICITHDKELIKSIDATVLNLEKGHLYEVV